MTDDRGERLIYKWYMDTQRDKGRRSILIDDIEEKLKQHTDPRELRALNALLAMEYASTGQFSQAEILHRKLAEEFPDDPFPLISLAGDKLYYEGKPEAAMPIIDEAIERAFRCGNFRRHALDTKARILKQLQDYKALQDVLRQLMQLKFRPENLDCGIERDFFDRLPPGAIDQDLARQFDEYSRPKEARK